VPPSAARDSGALDGAQPIDSTFDAASASTADAARDSSSPPLQDAATRCVAAFEPFSARIEDEQLADACCVDPKEWNDYSFAHGGLPPPISLACACTIADCPSLARWIEAERREGESGKCGCGAVTFGRAPGGTWTYDLDSLQLVGVVLTSDIAGGPCEVHKYRAGLLHSDCEDLQPCSVADVIGACAPADGSE